MAEIFMIKTPNGSLAPADGASAEYLRRHKVGQGYKLKATLFRNIKFHRKFFSLLQYAFEAWTPTDKYYKGEPVAKNFEQFRHDVTILAGFYEASVRLDGEVRIRAKSISFASMKEEEFERLYSAVIDVLLQRVFAGQTREDVDQVVNHILAYDS